MNLHIQSHPPIPAQKFMSPLHSTPFIIMHPSLNQLSIARLILMFDYYYYHIMDCAGGLVIRPDRRMYVCMYVCMSLS